MAVFGWNFTEYGFSNKCTGYLGKLEDFFAGIIGDMHSTFRF